MLESKSVQENAAHLAIAYVQPARRVVFPSGVGLLGHSVCKQQPTETMIREQVQIKECIADYFVDEEIFTFQSTVSLSHDDSPCVLMLQATLHLQQDYVTVIHYAR